MHTLESAIVNKEKRKYRRYNCNLSVCITTPYIGKKAAVCNNISENGAYIEVPFNKLESPNISIACIRNESVHVIIDTENYYIETYCTVKWTNKISYKSTLDEHYYGLGIQFDNISPQYKEKLKNLIDLSVNQKDHGVSLPTITLLINGLEVDTGIYDYQPYVEKLLTEPIHTNFVLKSLRQGEIVEDVSSYVYGRYCIADEKHFNAAIQSAYNASLTYKNFDVDRRTQIIVNIHNNLQKYKDNYINLLIAEGHPMRLAEWEVHGMLKGTSPETVHFYRMNLEVTLGVDKNERILLCRKPDGVVCLSTPKNAPSSISVIGVFALMAGNTIIVKPPLSIPISTVYFWKEIVYKSALENGAPPGVVNIVIGSSQKIFQGWLNSPLINDVIYIGDSKKGLEAGRQIYLSGKKPILELSGNDKVFIWKDAEIDKSTDALLECFMGSSQICMVPKMAFIHQNIFDEFINIFMRKVEILKPGLPSDPDTILSPVGKIADFKKTLDDALQKGGKLLCGGNKINNFGVIDVKGVFIQPTVVSFEDRQVSKSILCFSEENFFPLLPIINVTGRDDVEVFKKMIDFTQIDDFGLRLSVWANSESYIDKFVTNIMPGGIIRVNSSHVDFSLYLSNNGGTGKSGGPFGEMTYIWQKTTHLQGISITTL